MSQQKRKLGYWSIEFSHDGKFFFDSDMFCGFLDYLKNLDTQSSLQTDSGNNKAIAIDNIWNVTIQGCPAYDIRFKSCKYNHSPDYMSSTDGSERPTEKKLHEGDKEVTHLCVRVNSVEADCVVEERRQGVSFGATMKYLNGLLSEYFASIDHHEHWELVASIVPPKDFLTALNSSEKISVAEVFIDREVVGSEFLNLLHFDASAREEAVLTFKSKPRQSLTKRVLKDAFLAITTEGTKIRRIRLRGKDYNNMSVVIDSLNAKKKDEVTVQLLENGIVDSVSLFQKMEEALEE